MIFIKSNKRNFSSLLKHKLEEVIHKKQKEVSLLKKEFGEKNIGTLKVKQVLRGMRGVPGLLYETS